MVDRCYIIFIGSQTDLSSAMASRWRMEAVQQRTSLLVHMSHRNGPNTQLCRICREKYVQCIKNIYSAWKIFLLLQHWYVKCRQMCPQLKLQCFHLKVCKSADQKNNPFPVFPPLISVLQGNLCLLLNLSTKKEQYVIHDVQFQIQIQKINLVDNTAFKQTKMYIYFILVYFLWIKTIYLMLESKYWLSSAENVKSSSLPHLFNSICLEERFTLLVSDMYYSAEASLCTYS